MSTNRRIRIVLMAAALVMATGLVVAAPPAVKAKQPIEPTNLAAYLDARAEQLTAAAKPPTNQAQWQQWRSGMEKKLLAVLGLDPMPERTPLGVRLVGAPLDLGRATFQRVVFESRPKNYVAAHLYLPKEIKMPAPAIVYVPGHGGRDGYHQHPLSYASHGYVAINLPALGEEGKSGGGQGCGHKAPYYNDYHWFNTGYNPAGAEVWDTMRAIDYLLTLKDEKTGRPLVDPQRIGMCGRSGGAARTLWTAAAEPRIAAAVASEGFQTIAGYRRSIAGTCDVHLFYNYYGVEYGDLYGLAAPRCLLVQHGTTDGLYPTPQKVAEYLKTIYTACGKPECFDYQVFEQGHSDTPALRKSEYAWFDRWLGRGQPGVTPIADQPVPAVLRSRANVQCFASRPTDATNIEQQFTPPTPQWDVKDKASFDRFREQFSRKLKEEVLRTAFLPFTAELKQEGSQLTLVVDGGLRHRALFVGQPGASRKTVVLLAMSVKEAEPLAADFQKAGVNLLVVEPSGVDINEFPKGQRQHVLRLAMLAGETLTSLRVRDALGAVRALAASGRAEPKNVYLWGKGDLAVPALYAAIVDQQTAGVLLEDAPAHHTSETALFRVLRYADVPQSATLLLPRPIVFLGASADEFRWTKDVYGMMGHAGQCKTATGKPAIIVAAQ